VTFSQKQINQGKAILTLQTSGNPRGANQSGLNFGGRRELGGADPAKAVSPTS
jgi:hypothetical protein